MRKDFIKPTLQKSRFYIYINKVFCYFGKLLTNRILTGINKIKNLLKEANLSEPKFEFTTFFTVTFWRPKVRKVSDVEIKGAEKFGIKFSVKGKQLDRLILIVTRVREGKILEIMDIANGFNVFVGTLYKDISKLQKWGILRFERPPKTGRYILPESGKKILEEMMGQ